MTAAIKKPLNEVNDENNNPLNGFNKRPVVPKTVRPMTANIKSTNQLGLVGMPKKSSKVPKKSDPVSRYQSL